MDNFLYFPFCLNDTSTTKIYTLSLHDALPILRRHGGGLRFRTSCRRPAKTGGRHAWPHSSPLDRRPSAVRDRKSTRLNSSHRCISYAVFCLKKKNFVLVKKSVFKGGPGAWEVL